MIKTAAQQIGEKTKRLQSAKPEAGERGQDTRTMFWSEKKIRNGLISVESQFFSRTAEEIVNPRSFRQIAALLVQKTKNQPGERCDPRLNQEETPAGNEDAMRFAKEGHRCDQVMQHVEAENVRDAGITERESLRIRDSIEPWAWNEVSGEDIRRELFENTRSCSYFDRNAARPAKGKKTREKLLLVDAPQDGLSLPDAAVPEKLLLSLRVVGHDVF